MMKVLLPVFCLPPISWFAVFLQEEAEVTFEIFENFPKQTYRNRTVIYGANGPLSLIIPINHNGKRPMNEIEVSHRENWRNLHWKSIKTSYQSSPYFEYYEDRFEEIYSFETDSLLDFNLDALQIVQKLLKTEKKYSLSKEFLRNPPQEDYRNRFSPKKLPEFEMAEYYQTFTNKYGFQSDLSILDLLCNKGPESLTYLKNIKTNKN